MGYDTNMVWIIPVILSVFLFLFMVICIHVRNIDHKKRVQSMSEEEKRELFYRLLKPFGYAYDEGQELFITRIHAWQRQFGYGEAFDKMAVTGSMVFDCFPIYFDYMGKTWLLEIWKGQYGIACGCEIGLYHTDRLITEEEYAKTHFDSASDEELMRMEIRLEGEKMQGFAFGMRHWWLGGFRVGTYQRPEHLLASYKISFRDPCMMQAVLAGIRKSGYPQEQISVFYHTIIIYQDKENVLEWKRMRRLYKEWVLWKNHRLVRLFLWYTSPFQNTQDRILYLYFKVPSMLRWCLHHAMKGDRRTFGISGKN